MKLTNKETDPDRRLAGDTVLQNRFKFRHDPDADISSLN
jgi:hypothetical protein